MKTTLLACFAALLLPAAASAALLFSETYDTLAPGTLNGQNGWTAQSGVTVAAGGLNYSRGDIIINGGANRAQSNALSPNAATPLATASFAPQSGEVWFSFTMLVDSSANNARYWFWVSDTTDLNSGLTASVADNNTDNKNLFAEFRLNTTPTSTSAGGAAVEDQVYFFVARLSKDGSATNANAYDRLELWVNPGSTSLSGAYVVNAPVNASITGGIQHFGLTALNSAAELQWDNLLVGTSQADVLDIYAIPEPSACAAFGGLAALGLAALRRRRSGARA